MTIASRTILALAGLAAGVFALVQPAAAQDRDAKARIVSSARFGLVNARGPRLGPTLVRRGGYTPVKDMVRPRFVGGMIDIYPSTKTGFRFSVGDRYFAKTNFWRDSEQATNGLLFDPRMIQNGIGLQQRIYRRRQPAALVGYDTEIAPGVVAGIEGGTLFGHGINPGPRRGGQFRDQDRAMNKATLNPVATVAVRYAF
ncbi:MAG: hypothetical protein J0I47_10170 [Sphingomonas sp.]|uniref:hypothetical protein n=1 Tax=Sphingomonas sp. TaxID=28214 RepID=UPI001ACE2075|nr:hypothetical protein [Sphingomonas sp.]MBN8808578.1 hypothetical protein [Sphingomonas sp.]